MNNPYSILVVVLLLASARPGAAQRLATTTRPSAAAQRASDEFPGQIRPAEVVTVVAPTRPAPAPSDVVEGSDLELAHLQYIKNKVTLGMPLTKSETLFAILWMQRFPARK